MAEDNRVKTMDEQADFVMSFVDESRQCRKPMDEIWEETEQNFLVRPLGDVPQYGNTQWPLATRRSDIVGTPRGRASYSVLKDPETHQAVMTIVSKIVLGIMGEPGYIKARKVGGEDVFAASVASKLLEYALRQEGHFWTFVEWILSAGIYGTGVMEAFWHYEEGPREFRKIDVDMLGEEVSTEQILVAPIYDDVRYSYLDVRDFFPDPSECMMSRMLGAAKRFKITTKQAKARAASGMYRSGAVSEAIRSHMAQEAHESEDKWGDVTTGGHIKKAHPDFMQLAGYEYFGKVPYKTPDGINTRVVTVINGETVRSKAWPRRVPFFDVKITPRLGSFYGIGPAEIMRYDQDFADVLKMMLADAVVRATHPPHIYDRNRGVDLAKLRRFGTDVPIGVDGSPESAIRQVEYNPPVQPAFQMYAGVKQQMREGGGALGAIQGLGLGSKRYSATEAAGTFEQAMDRPELWAQIVEREYLPPIGKYTLRLYQALLQEGTDDLQLRVGETEYPVVLADILADFDVEFIGSRIEGNKQQKIAAFREIAAAGANPTIGALIPWIPLLQKWFDDLGASEISAMVGNPQLIQLHVMLNQILGPNQQAGNGNGTVPAQAPLGMMPAQIAGETAA